MAIPMAIPGAGTMWAKRCVAVLIGLATLGAPVASWATSKAAPVSGAAAAQPSVALLPLSRAVDTTGVRQREQVGACGDAANPARFAIRAAADGTVRAQTSGSAAAFDPVLILRDDRGRVVACNDDASRKTAESSLRAVVHKGQRYVLEVAGQGGSTGRTQLRADLTRAHSPHPMAGTAVIRGQVTDATDGKKITAICVTAFDQFGDQIGFAPTITGAYRLSGLPPTYVRIGFLACGGRRSAYVPQYWKNAPNLAQADPIKLRNGKVVSHIDAKLVEYGNIRGTVYDSGGRHPLAGICVHAASAILHSTLNAVTSVTGTYRLQVVSPVTASYTVNQAAADWYYVSFHDCSGGLAADEWWTGSPGGTVNPNDAVPLHLDFGETRNGIDARMHAGGGITGAVRNDATGTGVAFACVRITAPGRPTKEVRADISGRYRVSPLAPGAYTVFFSDCARHKLSSLYWKNTADPAKAQLVHVVAKQNSTGVNANLPRTGSIVGTTVDDHSGKVLPYMCLTLTGNEGTRTAQTDFNGDFRFTDLSVGPHAVVIKDCGFYERRVQYLTTYYQDAVDAAHATPVIVKASTKTKITAKVLRSGGIAGVVRAQSHQTPIVGSCVEVIDPHNGSTIAEMRSSVTGAYRFALAPGSYAVKFSSCAGGFYLTQYYNGATDLKHATPVAVGTGHDTSGIDASLKRGGGSISGLLRDQYGYPPYFQVCVQARTGKSPGRVVAETESNYSGEYALGGLPPGRYHIEFGHCSGELDYYAPTFYYHSPTYEGSSTVVVAANQELTDIDGRLDYGGVISGTLRDVVTGEPVNNVCVEAVSNDPDSVPQFSQTYYDGEFYIYSLPAGQYHLRIGRSKVYEGYSCGQEGAAAVSWYPKAIDEASSKAITLGIDEYLTGVNAFAYQGAQVTGFVTGADTGAKISSPCAQAYGSSGEIRGRAETLLPGVYAVFDLAPDTYKVRIASCGGTPYVPQFYDGASTIGGATKIPLAAGQVRSDIDAVLQPQGP
jgi:Carboxypeptidase regulatory-like domain